MSTLARIERRPLPTDWPDDAPMTLVEAEAVFAGELPITLAMLRTEIRKGRLTPAQVAGKFFVTPAQIKALFVCPAAPKARASISARGASTPEAAKPSPTSGLSEMDRLRSAQAAVTMACQALVARKNSLRSTSPANGLQRLARRSTANVIPLKSA